MNLWCVFKGFFSTPLAKKAKTSVHSDTMAASWTNLRDKPIPNPFNRLLQNTVDLEVSPDLLRSLQENKKLFDLLQASQDPDQQLQDLLTEYEKVATKALKTKMPDYLGLAATSKHIAQKAVSVKQFDIAWRMLHEQKKHYTGHANRYTDGIMGVSDRKKWALALDGSVHEGMANILRLEGKHRLALVHVLYWVSTTKKERVTKAQQQKLSAYFNRCKFAKVSKANLDDFVEIMRGEPNFVVIRDTVEKYC